MQLQFLTTKPTSMKRITFTEQHKSSRAIHYITLFLLSALLCLSASCHKDDGPDNPWGLPDATQTGANTFGCLINGEPWVAENNRLSGWDTEATYDEVEVGVADRYYFNVSAKYFPSSTFPPPDSAISDRFSIRIRPVYSEGEVDFPQLSRKDAEYVTSLIGIPGSSKTYRLDTLYNNYFEVTNLDTSKNTCSAKFSFRLVRNADILNITEGRFDVIYQPD